MPVACSIAARASSRRPRSASRMDWLFSEVARAGRNVAVRLRFARLAEVRRHRRYCGLAPVAVRGRPLPLLP